MDNAIKLFSVDLNTTQLTEDSADQLLYNALREVRAKDRVESTYGFSATQPYAIVMDLTHQRATVWGLTHEFCRFDSSTVFMCAGGGALIRCLVSLRDNVSVAHECPECGAKDYDENEDGSSLCCTVCGTHWDV